MSDTPLKLKYVGLPWIGIDLDGTLAEYNSSLSPNYIGPPIPEMVKRVKKMIKAGFQVKIFTARVSPSFCEASGADATEIAVTIEKWCKRHLGKVLLVTCIKDHLMIELWDDISLREVVRNSGYEKIKPPSI